MTDRTSGDALTTELVQGLDLLPVPPARSVPRPSPARRRFTPDPAGVALLLAGALVVGAVAIPNVRDAVGGWIQRAIPPRSVPATTWPLPATAPSRGCVMEPFADFKGIDQPPSSWFSRVRGWITYGGREGTSVQALEPSNPTVRTRLGPPVPVEPLAWSRDGTRLLLREVPPIGIYSSPDAAESHAGSLYVITADGSVTHLNARSAGWCGATGGALSPDGRRLAYSEPTLGLFVVDTDGGTPRALDDDLAEPAAEGVAWSPDGSRIAWLDFMEDHPMFGHHASGLSFVNPDGTGLRKMVIAVPTTSPSLVWSPDGSRLAFWAQLTGLAAQIYTVDVRTLELRQLTREGDNRWPAWSPDGSRIAFVRGGDLMTMSADGGDVRRVVGGDRIPGAIAWNPSR